MTFSEAGKKKDLARKTRKLRCMMSSCAEKEKSWRVDGKPTMRHCDGKISVLQEWYDKTIFAIRFASSVQTFAVFCLYNNSYNEYFIYHEIIFAIIQRDNAVFFRWIFSFAYLLLQMTHIVNCMIQYLKNLSDLHDWTADYVIKYSCKM